MLFFALGTLVGLPIWVGGGLALVAFTQRWPHLFREERLALAFTMGFSVWGWLVWIGYQLESSLLLVGVVYGILGLIGWGIVFLRKGKAGFRQILDGQGMKWLWAIALFGGIVSYFVGAYQDPSADSFRHLAFIRRLIERGVLADRMYILSPHEPHDLLAGAYARNAVHAWYGWVASAFGVEPARLWFHAPAVFVPLMFIALFAFARVVAGSPRLAMRTLVLWGVIWALTRGPLRAVGHPESLAALVIYPVWAMLLLARETLIDPVAVIGFVGLSSALFLIHSQWWMFALLTLGIRGIQFAWQREYRSFWALIGIGVLSSVLSLPLLLSRLPFYQPIALEMKEVLAYRYHAYLYTVGPLQGFLPYFVFSSWWRGLFGMSVGILVWKRAWYLREPLRFAAVMVGGVLGIMLTPLAGLIATVASTTIAARLGALVHLWGPPLFVAVLSANRSEPWLVFVRRVVGSGIAGWLLYRLLIWPAVKMGALQNVALREKLLLELAAWLHLPLATLKAGLGALLSWLPIVVIVGGLGLLAALAYRWRERLRLWQESLLRQGEIRLIVVLWAILLLAPGSQIAPWYALYSDRVYARLYGPTLSQTLHSASLSRLLDQIPPGAYVLSDNPNWLIAFRDVYVVNSVQGELRAGRRINAHFAPVFAFDTPIQKVLTLLREVPYPPEYLLLTPYRSSLSWMKYDRYPEVFEKVFDEVVPETTYFNRRFVLYRLHLEHEVFPTKESLPESVSPATVDMDMCEQRLYPSYRSVPPPDGWGRQGNELYDGNQTQPDHALLWILLRPAWFYVEFSFASPAPYIHSVTFSSYRFTSSSHLEEAALFIQQGTRFLPVGYMELPTFPSSPKVEVEFPVNRAVSTMRLAFYGEGPIPLDEVEIRGCPQP